MLPVQQPVTWIILVSGRLTPGKPCKIKIAPHPTNNLQLLRSIERINREMVAKLVPKRQAPKARIAKKPVRGVGTPRTPCELKHLVSLT
jgi:hypothetical protein